MTFAPFKSIQRRLERSIQTKLAFVLLMVSFVSLTCLGGLSVWLSRQEVQNEVVKRNHEVAVLISRYTQSYLESTANELKLAASSFYEVTNANRPNGTSRVLRFFTTSQEGNLKNLMWLDKFGKSVVPIGNPGGPAISQDNLLQLDLSDSPAFLAAKAGKSYASKIVFGKNNQPYVVMSTPITDSNNEFQGALLVDTSLSHLQEMADNVRTDQTSEANFIDENGVIFASSVKERIGKSLMGEQRELLETTDDGTTEFINERNQAYLAGYAPIAGQNGWRVIVAQSSQEAFSGVNRMAFFAIALVVLAIMAVSFVAVLLAKNITRPIRELAIATNRITTTGNLDEQIPVVSQDEVGELSTSFNDMMIALRKTRSALEHWNRELEHKVEIRTVELMRSNDQLEQINDELETVNLHKSQFLANMSHELRTPLNAIIGFSEVLQDQVFGSLNDKQTRYVTNILNSGRHLLNLVNDILDLSKVEAGKMELHYEEFSVRQLLSEITTQLSTLAAKKELNIKTVCAYNVDIIMADKGRFRQIVYNLLSNAIKFTPQGGTIEICGKFDPTTNNVVFEVRDNGIGIAPEYLDTIFESFRQVDNTYSRQYQGTGLGLALTRKLVEMHGGTVWVESKPNTGSTFSFTIPSYNVKVTQAELLPEKVAV